MHQFKKIPQRNKSPTKKETFREVETYDDSIMGINREKIRKAALEYLARFSTTRYRLRRVLTHRVLCWQRRITFKQDAVQKREETTQETAEALTHDLKILIDDVVQEMVNLGVVNDDDFSLSCANRFMRTGRSVQAVKKYLTTFGVEKSVKDSVFNKEDESEGLNETDRDLCAALVLARKRKFGPFASPFLQTFSETEQACVQQITCMKEKQEQKKRVLAVFARAGFVKDIVERVLKMDEVEAWEWLNRMRSEP